MGDSFPSTMLVRAPWTAMQLEPIPYVALPVTGMDFAPLLESGPSLGPFLHLVLSLLSSGDTWC